MDRTRGHNSGLNRRGKSCRLRWVNYLHPGLKRGKMTPQEERLVLELQAKWGNRWSKIARKLPGRTDNEIKNYWRTHMTYEKEGSRKKASWFSNFLTFQLLLFVYDHCQYSRCVVSVAEVFSEGELLRHW